MTLSRRMIWKIIALLASLALLGGASIWGLIRLHDQVRMARDEYIELRMVQQMELHLATARGLLIRQDISPSRCREELQRARELIGQFIAFQEGQWYASPAHQTHEIASTQAVLRHIGETESHLPDLSGTAPDLSHPAVAALDTAIGVLDHLGVIMDALIAAMQKAATQTLQQTILVVAALAVVIVLVAIAINVSQYRSVMTPLARLRDSARNIASGNFQERVEVPRDREFADVAIEFNRMSEELHALYRNLEERVRTKSRELVRSERLASVGFLAAGVAHEINNPLNIISGYAELLLRKAQDAADPQLAATLQIIRDETFRCKTITEKLLSLARPGEESFRLVSLSRLADEVVTLVSALKPYRDRTVRLQVPSGDPLTVVGSDAELKQILLNLTINALEASPPVDGRVTIAAQRRNSFIELTVSDNGRGMTSQTLEHVFEPFYTEKQEAAQPGTGLGLSITHAIVQAHGGRISASSEGPGRGSRFTVLLPAKPAPVVGTNHA